MQTIESQGGVLAAADFIQSEIARVRDERQRAFEARTETVTGVTDFPLLAQAPPDFIPRPSEPAPHALAPIRWAEAFETLRTRAQAAHARIFFANLGAPADFAARATFARNLLNVGGIAAIESERHDETPGTLIDMFRASGARVALIAGPDALYADHAAETARALKAAGADWLILAGKPGAREADWREAGVDQFVYTGQNARAALETLQAALGLAP